MCIGRARPNPLLSRKAAAQCWAPKIQPRWTSTALRHAGTWGASRRQFYEWLTQEIRIPGILGNERDIAFDDEKLRSAGIRLIYPTANKALEGVKSGILLELGFDDTAPNRPVTISSWAYDTAVARGAKIADNRARNVLCYAPTHTFVEKLQTISTKYIV